MDDATRQKIAEHRKEYDEFPYQWQCERRISFLGDELEDRIIDAYRFKLILEDDILNMKSTVQVAYTMELYQEAVKKILKLQASIIGLRESYQKTEGQKDRITEDMILRAKEYPFAELIKFDRAGFARCPWHEEKAPSLHLYKDKNFVYCFGCHKKADTIDFLMKLEGIDFAQAVKRLQ